MALKDSGLDLETTDLERIGVLIGNTFGGWAYTDRELRNLHSEGVKGMSPFQATAWFPAAPQGQLSILYGLKGYCKTVDAGRASGLASLGMAARAITLGRCDVMFAGGTEALDNPFARLLAGSERDLDGNSPVSKSGRYRPFDVTRDGCVPAEGSVMLILEEYEHAKRRGATPYAVIEGFALANCPQGDYAAGLSQSMHCALHAATRRPNEVGQLVADGMGTQESDRQEARASAEVFGARRPPTTAIKALTGHMCAAAGAMDCSLAALGLRQGWIPPTTGIETMDPRCEIQLVTEPTASRSPVTLINGTGTGGVCASLILAAA
jgi:3-oxoacyl-(acyl-carrier-protein) synthase